MLRFPQPITNHDALTVRRSAIEQPTAFDCSNGCNIDRKDAWLQIVRVGDAFCVYYSLDGEWFSWSGCSTCRLPGA